MIWERGQGRTGRPCCGVCFTPFGCASATCGCHVSRGARCRAPGCTTGLFVHIPTDHDRAVAAVQAALLTDYGYERPAA